MNKITMAITIELSRLPLPRALRAAAKQMPAEKTLATQNKSTQSKATKKERAHRMMNPAQAKRKTKRMKEAAY